MSGIGGDFKVEEVIPVSTHEEGLSGGNAPPDMISKEDLGKFEEIKSDDNYQTRDYEVAGLEEFGSAKAAVLQEGNVELEVNKFDEKPNLLDLDAGMSTSLINSSSESDVIPMPASPLMDLNSSNNLTYREDSPTRDVSSTRSISPKEATPPRNISPPRGVSPSINVSPPRDLSPPRSVSPPRGISPTRSVSPLRDVSPPRSASPPRDVSPPRSASPPRDVSPPRSASPPRDVSPPRSASPPRDVSPPRSVSPPIDFSPSPQKSVSPPREVSPPKDFPPPKGEDTFPNKPAEVIDDAFPLSKEFYASRPREPTPPREITCSNVISSVVKQLEDAVVPAQSARTTKYSISDSTKKSLAALNPLMNLIYWRDVKKSAVVFGSVLVVLLSLAYLSLISVVAYTSLMVLTGTICFRIYKNIMQAVQKSQDGHPFKEYLEYDTNVSSDKAHELTDVVVGQLNSAVSELKRLFLVEDLIDSVKFGFLLTCLTYVGAWFNGLTLVILCVIALFTLPKVYEHNQAQIDQYLGVVRSQVNDVMTKIRAAIPIGNKEKAQ